MSAPSVLEAPQTRDYFMLNGERSPGIAKITSGGGRKVVIEDQGQPLTFGKNSVVRGRANMVITYGFKLWLPAHFAQKLRWQAMFETGSNTLNPVPYKFVDLEIPNVSKVIYEDEDPQKPASPGGPWDWTVTLHEYRRVKRAGGPIIPLPYDDFAKRLTAENNAKQTQLNTLTGAPGKAVANMPKGKP